MASIISGLNYGTTAEFLEDLKKISPERHKVVLDSKDTLLNHDYTEYDKQKEVEEQERVNPEMLFQIVDNESYNMLELCLFDDSEITIELENDRDYCIYTMNQDQVKQLYEAMKKHFEPEDKKQILSEFAHKLLSNMKDPDPEFTKYVNENLWDLI